MIVPVELPVIVPVELQQYLRWDKRHAIMAARVMADALKLPRDRELIRQLAFVRVAQGIRAALWSEPGLRVVS